MRIDSAGRVMIAETSNSGYSANADDLIIGDNGAATERGISIGSTAGGGIRFNDGSDAGVIEYAHSDNSMRLYTAGSERARIDSSGDVRLAANATGAALIKGVSGNQTSRNVGGYPQFTFVGNEGTGMRRPSTNVLAFDTSGDESMRIDSSGNLLVGTTSGSVHLVIGGTSDTARVVPATDNVGYVGDSTHRWQAIYAVNGSIQTSDEREKTEIKETTLGLDFIKDLKPVSYKWIDGEQQNKGKDEREHQGLIAQQVAETVEKHGIDKNTFGGLDIQKTEKYDDFHGMSYDQFVAPLIKAIQEQQTQIEALQSEINLLKGE